METLWSEWSLSDNIWNEKWHFSQISYRETFPSWHQQSLQYTDSLHEFWSAQVRSQDFSSILHLFSRRWYFSSAHDDCESRESPCAVIQAHHSNSLDRKCRVHIQHLSHRNCGKISRLPEWYVSKKPVVEYGRVKAFNRCRIGHTTFDFLCSQSDSCCP